MVKSNLRLDDVFKGLRCMEADEVAVNAKLWRLAKLGDANSRRILSERVDGLDLYCHAMPIAENEIIVTIRDLEDCDVIQSVTLSKVIA